MAGLIDGDGCLQLSNDNYASLEITMATRDIECLYIIKNNYGGYVKKREDVDAYRYRLHHKEGMLKLINDINGLIRNPNRVKQLTYVIITG